MSSGHRVIGGRKGLLSFFFLLRRQEAVSLVQLRRGDLSLAVCEKRALIGAWAVLLLKRGRAHLGRRKNHSSFTNNEKPTT